MLVVLQSVLLRSEPLPDGTPTVQGHDFETGRNIDAIMEAMLRSGFQATNMGQAVNVVNEMVRPQHQLGLITLQSYMLFAVLHLNIDFAKVAVFW